MSTFVLNLSHMYFWVKTYIEIFNILLHIINI